METQAARVTEGNRGNGVGFEPETILPSQYFDRFQIDASLQPEKRLMLAVLEDAIDCYQKYAFARESRGQEFFAEAEEWLFSSDNAWVFSYENICQTLDLNPDYIRRGLQEWRQRTVADAGRVRIEASSDAPERRLAS